MFNDKQTNQIAPGVPHLGPVPPVLSYLRYGTKSYDVTVAGAVRNEERNHMIKKSETVRAERWSMTHWPTQLPIQSQAAADVSAVTDGNSTRALRCNRETDQ